MIAVDPIVARLALANLLETDVARKAYTALRDHRECILPEHPFGLEIKLEQPKDGWEGDTQVRLIAEPLHTDDSVEAMLTILQGYLQRWNLQASPFRLRIVRVQSTLRADGSYTYDVYFELITISGTFMCGGCTDGYYGAGSNGTKKLRSAFNFIGAIYGVVVEVVEIPLAEGNSVRMELSRIYAAFLQERTPVEA